MSDGVRTQPGFPKSEWMYPDHPKATIYSLSWTGVIDQIGKLLSIDFGPYAQHERYFFTKTLEPHGRTRTYRRGFQWGPDKYSGKWMDGWFVIAKGYHPLPKKEISEVRYGCKITSCYEHIFIETFDSWMAQQNLELLVDFRQAASDEGWINPWADHWSMKTE
jgi:hypothetical protein